MTAATASGNSQLEGWARLIRAAAGLIEQAGITGLVLYPEQDAIIIQVPEDIGAITVRAAAVARLAALTGGTPAPDPWPGRTRGWIRARGQFAGHLVIIYAPVREEPAP